MSDLLDLPNELLSLILGQTQWSARRTCRALLDHQSAGRTSLRLKWGKDDPRSSEQLAGLLAQLPRLAALGCVDTTGRVRDISPIAAVGHHLKSLELHNFSQLGALSAIGACSRLSSLKISLGGARPLAIDLSPLSSCTLLTDVDVRGRYGCPLSDLGPLAACVHIKSLHLSDKTDVVDLSPLSSLVELTSLRLGSRYLQRIDALAACTRLAELRLIAFSFKSPLVPLACCPQLRSMCLSSSCTGADLLPLAHCPHLTELTLQFCDQLSDVGALRELLRLQSLTLWVCRFLADISPLSRCAVLRSLVIGHCRVSEESICALKAATPQLSVTKTH